MTAPAISAAMPMTLQTSAYRVVCRLRRDRHLAMLENLRATERWTPGQVRDAQEAGLRALLLHAYEHVPYYRTPLAESGVVVPGRPPRVDLSRFDRVPILTRAAIRQHYRALHDRRPPARGNPRMVTGSAGTTGDPLLIARDWEAYQQAMAVQLWFDGWAGHTLGQSRVVISEVGHTPWQRARRRATAWLRHETWLPSRVLSDAVIDAHIERINALRPRQVMGLANAVFRVAQRAEVAGHRIVPPQTVMVMGEPCFPDMRGVIRRAFQAPVIDRYGTSETGGIACQCRFERGLHVAAPVVRVEILRPDGRACAPGEVGEIVVTRLTNHAMPLIRYRIGDLGALEPPDAACPCGRPFPALREVAGRALDAFVRRDGSLVHGIYVRRFYHWVPWLRRFQVIQLTHHQVHVKLVDHERVPDPMTTRREDLAVIAAHLRRVLGGECEVAFEFVEDIPAESSGKYRATLSLVAHADGKGEQP